MNRITTRKFPGISIYIPAAICAVTAIGTIAAIIGIHGIVAALTTFVSSGVKLVSPGAMYPVSRAVTSWKTQALPSGSLSEANEA